MSARPISPHPVQIRVLRPARTRPNVATVQHNRVGDFADSV